MISRRGKSTEIVSIHREREERNRLSQRSSELGQDPAMWIHDWTASTIANLEPKVGSLGDSGAMC